MKKVILSLIILMTSILLFSPGNVYANGIPYNTYTYSSSNKTFIWTQDAYVPLSLQYDIGGLTLNNPQDITIDSKNNIFIADTGLKAIIKYNLETDTSLIIGENFLVQPMGIHVGNDDKLYVADYGSKEAYQFTYNEAINQYEVTNTYKKPTNTPYFEESDVFEPTKIITDHANLVYIVLANNFNGLAKYNDKGEFTGYFGGNQLPKTFENMIKSLLFDEQQRREWFKMIPNPVYNVGVDHSGLIVTTTKLEYGYKKINIANQVYNESLWGFDDIEDVFVGPNHTIFTISKEGMIVEYSPEGEVLFIFSGKDDFSQKGLFKNPTGIAVDSKNNLYAIDSQAKSLQIFIPTEFADTIHEAITLYYDGRYSESLEPWQKVLKMNALFDLANKGIGDAYFAQMEYEKAMESYVVARETEGYSQAFWEVRNKKLLDNGTTIVIIIFSLVLLVLANQFLKFGKYLKKPFVMLHKFLKKFKLYNELLFGFYVIKKPSDAFYGIKREKKGSNLAAIIYYLLFFIVYMIWLYNTNFIFNDVVKSEIVVFTEIIKVFLPILLWVFSNYLIGNIRDGEGKMSDIFQGTAYILLPAIITLPILTFISHYLTFNEAFIYNIFAYIGIGLSAIYLVIMVKEIHFYDMKPTIANIFITIFTAIILVVFTLIVYLLLNEIIGLVLDIIREVSNRV